MTRQKKEHIDQIWMSTEYGQWVLLGASGKVEEANQKLRDIRSKYPWDTCIIDTDLSQKIASNFNHISEFEEYLKLLDAENPDIVDFMISQGVFDAIYKMLPLL